MVEKPIRKEAQEPVRTNWIKAAEVDVAAPVPPSSYLQTLGAAADPAPLLGRQSAAAAAAG